jgi:hypothetical protein
MDVEYLRPLVDQWSPRVERWTAVAQASPSVVKLYGMVTAAAGLIFMFIGPPERQGSWFNSLVLGIVVWAVLIRSIRGWGAGMMVAVASVWLGLDLGMSIESVLLVLYGIVAAGLLLSPQTRGWIKPFEVRS